jgi:hypothetical protein
LIDELGNQLKLVSQTHINASAKESATCLKLRNSI